MPKWLPRLAEAVAEKRLNSQGIFESFSGDPIGILNEIQNELEKGPTDDDWVIWGRWFLADRSTRTISPFSKITIPEYIENRIKENTKASLEQAEQRALGNVDLLKRIARAREGLPKRPAHGTAGDE